MEINSSRLAKREGGNLPAIRCSCGKSFSPGSGEIYYRFVKETVCPACLADYLAHLAGNCRLTA